MKDIGEEITLNARIVDVESGEVLSISRTTVEKDKYLRDYIVTQKKAKVEKERVAKEQKEEQLAKSKWEVFKNRNKYEGYTTYTFINRTATDHFLFVGYDKYDNRKDSVVLTGIRWDSSEKKAYWTNGRDLDINGIFELKGDSGNIYHTINITYGYYWSFSKGSKANRDSYDFIVSSHQMLDRKSMVNMFGSNKTIDVTNGYTKHFDTSMFWEVLEANGITKEEIYAAIDYEDE